MVSRNFMVLRVVPPSPCKTSPSLSESSLLLEKFSMFFYLGRSHITMKPFLHLGRSLITMRPLFSFYLGRSPITMGPLHIFHLGRSNQGLNCTNIEVWWAIRDLIEEIQNQGPKWKTRVNRGVVIDRIRD